MSISPVQLTRTSFNLRTTSLLDTLRRTSVELLESQMQLATGRRLLRISDSPVESASAIRIDRLLEEQQKLAQTLSYADDFVSATDTAMVDISDLLIQAMSLASENINSTVDQAQRDSAAELINGMIDQLVTVGNRRFLDTNLFGGHQPGAAPFREISGGILYTGDTGQLNVRFDANQQAAFNITGDDLYGALTSEVAGTADLSPGLTAQTRLSDLNGARGLGVSLGTIQITESGGPTTWQIDLSAAHTVQDVIDIIDDATGSTIAVSISGGALQVAGPGSLTVTDLGGGTTAADLGILQTTPAASPIAGSDTDPRLTLTTTLATLNDGAGLTLTDPLVITNGPHSATIDLSSAATIEDVLNALNNAGVYVYARINDAGTGIDVVNRLSGAEMHIAESGGTTATDLGIRSYHASTPLAALNGGQGVEIIEGKVDLTIIDSNGATYDVNLDGATTIQDVIDKINAVTGAAITASLVGTGNGIRLVEAAPGAGQLRVVRPDIAKSPSFAAEDLGFGDAVTVVGNGEIISRDVNGIQPNGVFSALLRLRDALIAGDQAEMTLAAAQLEDLQEAVTSTHGMVGATSQMFSRRLDELEASQAETQVRLSELVDLDYAEAITRFSQLQTALQANLSSSAQLLSISFLDYLR